MKSEPIKDKDLIKDCLTYLEYKNPRNKVLFAIGIYTGLRISDILKLRVKDVYCKNRIEVKQKKTGKYVYIPINNQLKKIIKEYCEDRPGHEYLIISREGRNKPLTRNQAYNILKDMAEYFSLESISNHSMRKTCGYHLYNASGKDIGIVMQVLGQIDPGSTLRYIGISDMDIDKSIRKLNFL